MVKAKIARRSNLSRVWKVLRGNPTTLVGVVIVSVFIILIAFGPLIALHSPTEQDMSIRLKPPSSEHPLGTDQFGRDILSRIIIGSRNVGAVASLGTAIAVLAGLALGMISGYVGGIVDDVIMRFEVMMAILGYCAMLILFSLGSSMLNVILVVGFVYTPVVSRVVKCGLDYKTRQFVEAANYVVSVFYILAKRYC